jgi:Ca-activated chloride channel family protein
MARAWLASLIVLVTTALCAQESPTAVQSPERQRPTFTTGAELVVVHVTVKDRKGAYVPSLPREAFQVVEDGKPQRIDFFSGEDSPITVGFLLDNSGSMRESRERVIAAVTAFAGSSNSQDEMFALAFNEHVRATLPPSMPFTSSANVLRASLVGAMSALGLTAMHDAIATGLSYVAKGNNPRRALIVLGDGGDNASMATFEQVLRAAQASNATIYTVGIIDPLERQANPKLLQRLARATGGESFFPSRLDQVGDVFRRIAHDVRHSYTLGYVSSNPARDGQYRQIRVAVTDSGGGSLSVRTRDGYRASGIEQKR